MGKFFNGKVKKKKSIKIKYILIGVGILIGVILMILFAKALVKKSREVVITPKESVEVQLNGEYPTVADLFTKIKNYNPELLILDYNGLDISEIGAYTVLVTGNNHTFEISVKVVDTIPPELTLKESVTIAANQLYDINDFVESCTDNSEEDCILEYIDEQIYTENGTYDIIIKAKDGNDNYTKGMQTKLIIGDGKNVENPDKPETPEKPEEPETPIEPEEPEKPQPPVEVKCDYGSLEVHEQYDFPIAVIVGNETTKCALDRNLWDDQKTQDKVYDFYTNDNNKLRTELSPIIKQNYPNGANIVVQPKFLAVLNKEQKGLVGYGIYVEVYISSSSVKEAIDTPNNLKLAYYLKSDGTRVYDTNIYKFN